MRAAGVESPPTLSEHFVGARTTRKENDPRRRSFSAPRSAFAARLFPLTVEHTAFWAERAKTAIGKKFESKNSKKEARGKTLNYSTESAEVRHGLDASRKVEWEKW